MASVFLCGEDKRFIICKKHLKKKKVITYLINKKSDLENTENPKIIVLPIQGINIITDLYKTIFEEYSDCIFIVYNVTEDMKKYIDKYKLKTLNLSQISMFSKLNNVATAEATLKDIVEKIAKNFSDIRVAILGYGKCGKEVYELYKRLNMNVDVYVRREEVKNSIGKNGFLLKKLEENIAKYDLIVNTIPANVIDDSLLHNVSINTVLLDLASSPYGWNHELAKYLGLYSYILKGLPSIYRYETIGETLSIIVLECLKL